MARTLPSPQTPLRPWSPLFVPTRTRWAIRRLRQRIVNDAGQTFEGTIAPLDAAWRIINVAGVSTALAAESHPNRITRLMAGVATPFSMVGFNEILEDERVAAAVTRYAAGPEAATLDPVRRRLVSWFIKDLTAAGMDLEADAKKTLRATIRDLSRLEDRFLANLNREPGHLDIPESDLGSADGDPITRLPPGATPGTRRVNIVPSIVYPLLETMARRDIREELERRVINRARAQNEPLLEEILRMRLTLATLTGRASFAELALDGRQSESPQDVRDLIATVVCALRPIAAAERGLMRKDLGQEAGVEGVRTWDVPYLIARRRAATGFDPEIFRPYLPLRPTESRLMTMLGSLLGLRVTETAGGGWAPTTRRWEVTDVSDGRELATIVTDLTARPGKGDQAFSTPLRIGGSGDTAGALVSMNLAPDPDGTIRLTPERLETLCHEVGHAFHIALMAGPLARFATFEGHHDAEWLEAPSQVFERLASEPSVMSLLARHEADGRPLSETVLETYVSAQRFGKATLALQYIYRAALDQGLHSAEPLPVEKHERRAHRLTGLPHHQGTSYATAFGHLAGGYAGGFYGYLLSEIWGAMIWERFAANPLDPAIGEAFRREILEPGWSRSPLDSIRAFTGRSPDLAPYIAGFR